MLPGVAPVAKQQGQYVARALIARHKGRTAPAFRYRDFGSLATIGRRGAVAQLAGFTCRASLAWVLWSVAHVYFLIGFRNRFVVALNWAWSYLTFQRGSRLITGLYARVGWYAPVAANRTSIASRLKNYALVVARGNICMEMHQVRYFLAVARTLNFTRAADECNVAQPSLTRAIKLLEGELGGDLFRRERPRAMLTPLGERMFPLLKQCYDSAQSARALAAMINDGEVGALKLAVSSSIELGLILSHVNELRKSFSDVELKILRGTGPQIVEYLKSGDAELAVRNFDRRDLGPARQLEAL